MVIEYSKLNVMFKKPVLDGLSFVSWCFILLQATIRSWVHCGQERMGIISSNTRAVVFEWHSKCTKSMLWNITKLNWVSSVSYLLLSRSDLWYQQCIFSQKTCIVCIFRFCNIFLIGFIDWILVIPLSFEYNYECWVWWIQ